jgi:hypothetical protein
MGHSVADGNGVSTEPASLMPPMAFGDAKLMGEWCDELTRRNREDPEFAARLKERHSRPPLTATSEPSPVDLARQEYDRLLERHHRLLRLRKTETFGLGQLYPDLSPAEILAPLVMTFLSPRGRDLIRDLLRPLLVELWSDLLETAGYDIAGIAWAVVTSASRRADA